MKRLLFSGVGFRKGGPGVAVLVGLYGGGLPYKTVMGMSQEGVGGAEWRMAGVSHMRHKWWRCQ